MRPPAAPRPRRLMDQEAYGPFFRPVYDDWLTSFHVIKGWQWYQHYRSHGRNPYASSLKSYFGFDPLSFAARCFLRFTRIVSISTV